MNMSRAAFLVSLALSFMAVPSLRAGDLAAMQFTNGWYLFGTSDNGVMHQALNHNFVQNVQVENHLAYVQALDGHWLYGLTPSGFVSRRFDDPFPQAVSLGEDIAVVESFGMTRIYALAQNGIVHADVARGRPVSVRVAGRLVFMSFGQQHILVGATPAGITSININGFPAGIELVRDTAVVRYTVGGTWVVGLNDGGFVHSQVSNGSPSTIRLPRSTSAQGAEIGFAVLHGEPGEKVEIVLEPAATIGE